MNLMKYDAATIGNHDIEAGPDVYNRLKDEFKFPWLGANVLDIENQVSHILNLIRLSDDREFALPYWGLQLPACQTGSHQSFGKV
jgi:2',3'-cyclic-nucleotide 2'-phosphodiesterase (5'-nucleotidase family)